jgi:CheY-like chemotaxis protein
MKKRILLAEDHPATQEVMRQELEFLGYEVALADNGLQAVEMAAAIMPDLIVMDILMPQMDGLEAAARLRNQPATRGIPIVAATAKAQSGDKEHCLANGFDAYIAKPFTHRQLGVAIEQLLTSHRAQ